MKKNITLALAFLLTCLTLFGQRKQGYDNDSRWFWTFNAGATWTTADVKSKNDWGWGLTLGKSFNYNYGKLVSFDIRGRFLTGKWYGQDTDSTGFGRPNLALSSGNTNYRDSLGFTVLNHYTRASEVSLELVMHLNKLREKTGWDIYVFGGIGITGFKANGDLLNSNDSLSMYDYDELPDFKQSTLNSTLDGTYESTLDGSTPGKATFGLMPSLGFGIGYQLAPRWSIGLEHKTTFTKLDYFDGYNDPAGKYENDWYHYTSAYTRFHLKKRTPTTPVTNEVTQVPEVIFTNPNVSGTTVSQPNYNIRALVKFVNGRDNINFRQNGNYVGNFSYDSNSDRLESNVVLVPGQNVFEIIASNAYGTDQETTIIIYRQAQEAPPVVDFVNPKSNPHTTSNQAFGLVASVLNVQTTSQVNMTVNGQTYTNFNFNPANGNLNTTLNLNIGSNVVTITGTNASGSDSETTTIIYNPVQNINVPLPVVYFTDPNATPTTVSIPNYTLSAEVMNVDGRENITFKQNGTVNQNFVYNANSDDFQSSVILVPGQNVFEIIASNTAGVAQATTIIIFERMAPKPPVVTITNPANTPYTTENSIFALNATVLNVTMQSQVLLTLNGQNFTNFIFTPGNNNVAATLNLLEGTNTVVVRGTNNDGTDSKQVVIIYRKPATVQPPLVTYSTPSSTPYTVSTPNYTVNATVLNVDNSNGINVNVNGANFTGFSFNSATKLLTFNLNLIEGVNVVVVTGTNAVGVDSKSTTLIYRKANVVTPPVVTFIDPIVNPFTVFTPSYGLKARVQNVTAAQNITLRINGVLSTAFIYNASTQLMEFSSGLITGANIFEITAVNTAGQDSKSTTIIYREQEPMVKPVVTITTPVLNPYTTSTSSAGIEATVLNVESQQNIQVLVNNVSLSGFAYNATSKRVNFTMSLNEGSNTVVIKATNMAGEAQDSRTVIYRKEVKIDPPVVTFVNPAQQGTTVTASTYVVKANILNVENASQITLYQNGMAINGMMYNFNPATKELIFNTGLNLGNNIFMIQATNSAGTHSATTNVIYKQEVKPCDKPVITFLNPNASGLEIAQSNNAVKLKILNATVATQIQVLVNGVLQNPGAFNPSSKIYDLNVNYTLGQNIVEVIAKNACGETKASTVVLYKEASQPCSAPVIQLIQPINMESTVDLNTIEVRVNVLNIANQSQIIFKVNGVDKSFQYNNGNHILVASVDLVEGLNTVLVQASNDCGSGGFPVKITRRACKKPRVNITSSSIAENTSTIMETFTMEGNASDIADASQMSIKLNGMPINFVFNANTKTFSFTTALGMKVNTFELKVTNSCGEETRLFKVIRNPDPNAFPPKITITNPVSTPFPTTNGAFNVQATTQYVTAANQVSLTINGNPVNANFNVGNNSLTYNMTLVEGNNIIVATAVNQYGSSSDTKTVVYSKPVVIAKPVVVLTQPGSCPAILPEGTNQITGYILNVTDLNKVAIRINGQQISNYNPVLQEGKLSFQFTVNMASNNNNLELIIAARNDAGSDSKSCVLKMQEKPVDTNCMPQVSASFSTDSKTMTATSNMALINVAVKFHDNSIQFFGGLSGMAATLSGTNENAGKCIVGAWIRSGCNETNAGKNYGEWVANPKNTSNCASGTTPTDCKPTVRASFTSNAKSVTATSSMDLTNVVLKYYDGQEQMFQNLSGKTTSLSGTGANAGKCITGVWIKSGCNTSTDGTNYGEYVANTGYSSQCSVSNEPCGPRFNPGNSAYEFCLVTPNGTFTRDNLASNANFTYSGPATSVYFKPIAGGGPVTVNGSPMMLENGNYYLFTGTLTVEIKNPNGGGNGHWTICLQSNTMPTFGTGNNKPTSPCEPQKSIKTGGTDPGKPKPTGGNNEPAKTPTTTPATNPTRTTTTPTRGGK